MTSFSIGPWRPVGPHTWQLTAEPDSVNIGLIAGRDGCVLVDCGSSPEQGGEVRAAISQVTEVPLRGVVVTHAHRDHWFGLAAFDDVTTWGHESLADVLTDEALLDDARALGVAAEDLRAPNTPVSLVTAFDLGDLWVEVAHVGPGHTPSDMIVVVPEDRVIFAGDVAEGTPDSQDRPAPEYGPESDPERWSLAADAVVSAMQKPGWQAVPGHGPVLDKEQVSWQRGLHTVVHGEIQRLGREGATIAEAETAGHWPWDWDRVRAKVEDALPQIRPERQLPIKPV